MTDPHTAADSLEQTSVDTLAVSIGNVPGLYKAPPNIDFERLRAIRQRVDVPIVIHGGSDLSEEIARAVVREDVSKLNSGTDLNYAFSRCLRQVLSRDPLPFQPPEVLGPARAAICEVAREKIRTFESTEKANQYA